jgi:hypothetical protein
MKTHELYANELNSDGTGKCVASGSTLAMEAAAKLLDVPMKRCITPNGRLDSHRKFVKVTAPMVTVCEFCGE